ncbi:MAG: Ig-like domain-containing protein, partial [Bacteroidales bacterium]|nr:Ig-like domain-containing protein [Bacteroidales bacterium]
LFYGNTASNAGAVIYRGGGTVTSGGYNVYDGTSYDFTFNGTGDTQITALAFDSDIRPTDAVADIVAAGLANLPAEFFNGETRTFPNGTAGAMKASDVTAPTVASVTPSGTGAATSGNIVITFNEAMDAGTTGTVQLNSLSALTSGTWSVGNTVFTVAYSGLTYSTAYTVNISGFEDAAGNAMIADNTHSFTTAASGTSTGVGETLKADISACPNPFKGALRLTGAEGCTLTVFTTTGSIVHTQKVTAADETISLEHLPTGLYLFRLEKDGKTKTMKIVNN